LLRDEPLFEERPPPFELDDERRLRDDELPLFFDEPRLREDELLLPPPERFGSPPFALPRRLLEELRVERFDALPDRARPRAGAFSFEGSSCSSSSSSSSSS
jgi:hypothetical protein